MSLPAELAQWLSDCGYTVSAYSDISGRSDIRGKFCLRLTLADGRLIKCRRLASLEHAQRWLRIRKRVGDKRYLAKFIANHDQYVLEEWVTGSTLSMINPTPIRLRKSGEVLASLHNVFRGRNRPVPIKRDLAWIQTTATKLCEAAGFSDSEQSLLQRVIYNGSPAATNRGVIHYDFCGENLIWSTTRGIVSIDHEWMSRKSLEFDLARTMLRWDLNPDAKRFFLEGYWQAGGIACVDHLHWWLLINDIASTEVACRWQFGEASERVAQLLEKLRLVDSHGLGR